MRLWMKVSLLSAALGIVALGTCTAAILNRTARNEMDREIAGALNEHYAFSVSLASAAAAENEPDLEDVMRHSLVQYFFGNYAKFYLAGGAYFSLVRQGQYLYNVCPYSPVENLPASLSNARTYIITNIGGARALIIEGSMRLAGDDYTVYLSKDISAIYKSTWRLAQRTALIALAFSTALAAAFTVMIRLAMRPLHRLSAATVQIAGGHYGNRVPESINDEVGDVSRSFNRMAEAVQARVEELQWTAERQKLFMAGLTHELKTPMTSIIGYSEALLKARVSPAQKVHALEHIHNESVRVERLSQKMMGLLSLGSGERPEMTPVPVRDLLERTAGSVYVAMEARKQNLALRSEQFYLTADADLMVSLLINLVDNASKASPEGAVIRVSSHTAGGGACVLEVADSGRGIPQRDLSRVTEPFYRVDRARSHAQGGTGLGLALCKAITDAHRAKLEIESEEGRGTTVRVIFPTEGGACDKQNA